MNSGLVQTGIAMSLPEVLGFRRGYTKASGSRIGARPLYAAYNGRAGRAMRDEVPKGETP